MSGGQDVAVEREIVIQRSLFLLLETKCHCRLVANLSRTEVLDWTWINIACITSPFVAVSDKVLEWSTIEFHESLANNGFVLAITTFDVHHHCDGHTTGNPFGSRSRSVLDN